MKRLFGHFEQIFCHRTFHYYFKRSYYNYTKKRMCLGVQLHTEEITFFLPLKWWQFYPFIAGGQSRLRSENEDSLNWVKIKEKTNKRRRKMKQSSSARINKKKTEIFIFSIFSERCPKSKKNHHYSALTLAACQLATNCSWGFPQKKQRKITSIFKVTIQLCRKIACNSTILLWQFFFRR